MPYILYYVYLGIKPDEEKSRVPIDISTVRDMTSRDKRLVALVMNDLGLEQLFSDAWWSREYQGEVYLKEADVVDPKIRVNLESMLKRKKDGRDGKKTRTFLAKRKTRKGNYAVCVKGLVPDWVDAEFIDSGEVTNFYGRTFLETPNL